MRCYNGHKLSVNDDLKGKRVRCPKCKVLFRADAIDDDDEQPVTPSKGSARRVKTKKKPDDEIPPVKRVRPALNDDDDDDDDYDGGGSSSASPEERRKARQRDKKQRLSKVTIGLLMHIIKLWVLVVLVLFFFLTTVFAFTVETSKSPNIDAEMKLAKDSREMFEFATGICGLIVMCLVVLTPIVGVVGSGFCCIIPKKSEARGTIIGALVFDLIPLVASILLPMTLFDVFDLEQAKKDRLLELLMAGSVFFSIAALFVFLIFLRQLAYYLQKALLAAEGLNLLSWLMIMTFSAPALLFGMGFLTPILTNMLGAVICLAALFLLTLVWFGTFYYMFFQGFVRLLKAERAVIADVT